MPNPGKSQAAREASVMVFDMSAAIYMIKPQHAKVFGDYTQMHLLPFLEGQISNNTLRIDAVWDTYQEGSLKSQARAKRGETAQRRTTRVSAKIPVPKGAEWHKFLKESLNKDQLFQFLSKELIKHTADARFELYTTKCGLVLSNRPTDITDLSPCNQEIADT